MNILWAFLLSMISHTAMLHASEGEVYEEVIEEEHTIPDTPAEEFDSSSSSLSSSSDPASASLKDEVTFLRAQVVSLRNAVESMQKKKESETPSENTDDVQYVLSHVAPKPSERMKKFDAHTEAEATAMEEAEQKAPTLPGGKMQRDFNALQKAYNEITSLNIDQQKSKLSAFRKLSDAYIKTYETDSSSRSALYYLGHILFTTQHYKESLNVLARVYKGDEEGPHAADALLYMAQIFHKEKNTEAALKFLEKVKKDFRPEYLTQNTKDLFHRIAKELGSNLTLSKEAVKTAAAKKDPISVKKETGSKHSTQTSLKKSSPSPSPSPSTSSSTPRGHAA